MCSKPTAGKNYQGNSIPHSIAVLQWEERHWGSEDRLRGPAPQLTVKTSGEPSTIFVSVSFSEKHGLFMQKPKNLLLRAREELLTVGVSFAPLTL